MTVTPDLMREHQRVKSRRARIESRRLLVVPPDPMPGSVRTETETVIKRILPYLQRRGYEVQSDLDFETGVKQLDRYSKGYVDVLVTCGKEQPQFVIEAKKTAKRLTDADRKQAIGYGKALKVPFVIVTNGTDIQACNIATGGPIAWDGKPLPTNKIPTKAQLTKVLAYLRTHKDASEVPLGDDPTLPFRPGLPLKQLNALFARCHNAIRNIEKNEEHAFADFSKLLFLKLLEEKHNEPGADPLSYSFRFHELAEIADSRADQVKAAVLTMLEAVRKMGYGDVLGDSLYLSKAKTFSYIVQELAAVSFSDSLLDTKGAAFEYFVRATLKGKKLGQYFTPRPLVELMSALVGRNVIVNSLLAGESPRVLDPACGTGGFLVWLLKDSLVQLQQKLDERAITRQTHTNKVKVLMSDVFHGADANDVVASAAKMNMIIAGDGHANIRPEDSLRRTATVWSFLKDGEQQAPLYDLILTNPPFGTSESDSLAEGDLSGYDVRTAKGQLLFLQRMVQATKPGGRICTVIDEGVLNNENDAAVMVRRMLLTHCWLEAVIRLPEETFKANKINLLSSVLLLKRRDDVDENLADNYPVAFCDLLSLGAIRGFNFRKLMAEFESGMVGSHKQPKREGTGWRAFDVPSKDVFSEPTHRLDLKFWEPGVRERIQELAKAGAPTIEALNTIETERGKSPPAELYVDANDGHALVVKAGTSISKLGQFVVEDDADWIEKAVFEEYVDARRTNAERADKKAAKEGKIRKPAMGDLAKHDVLLASTGDGTLGKACVFDRDVPAVADGHVTVIRVDPAAVVPSYLADYLRCGFGQDQIQRLFTGSTGLIELTPEHVRQIVVDMPPTLYEQRKMSAELREEESRCDVAVGKATSSLAEARQRFHR